MYIIFLLISIGTDCIHIILLYIDMLGYEMDIRNIEIDINILYPNNDLYCNNMRKLNNDIDVEKIGNCFVQNIHNMLIFKPSWLGYSSHIYHRLHLR